MVIAIIDMESEIFTRTKHAVTSLCTSVSNTHQDTPSNLPHLFFHLMDNSSTAEDMENNENAVNMAVELRTYTKGNTAYNDGKKILKLADTEMRNMGFKRNFGPQQVTNLSDTSITQVISRYERVIASNDTL